jgi:ribokinase
MKDVVGFGALNVDLFFRVTDSQRILDSLHVERCCAQGGFIMDETPSSISLGELLESLQKEGELMARSGGGSAANTIYALARMGFSTGYVGRVGSDGEGEFLVKELESVGVDTTGVTRGTDRTGLCIAIVDREGERRLLVFPNENGKLTVKGLATAVFRDVKFVHLTSFIGAHALETQKSALQMLPSSVKMSFDPGEIYARQGLQTLQPLVERSYLIFVGKREVEILSGEGYESGVKKLKEIVEGVVCKLGKAGVDVFWKDESFHMPAPAVKALDTTGAGDVYAAGFIAGLLLDQSIERCAWVGTRLAGKSITGYGRRNYPDEKDLKRALNERFEDRYILHIS